MNKTITMRSSQESILKQFKHTQENGGETNLETDNGFIYMIGGYGGILCKLEGGVHYTYQRNKKMWVEL